MPLSPEDVVRKSFTTSILRRGYDEREVDHFLEEVVAELRRLNDRTDELEAELAARAQRDPEAEISERVQREQQQVELIRAERRDLVSEMAGVQARFERTTAETRVAEEAAARAVQAAEEADASRAEAEHALETTRTQLTTARAEYDETVAALERAAAELRTLRVAAEEGAGDALSTLDIPDQPGAQGDLLAVLAIARRMHDDHVEAGRRDAERARAEAAERAEQLLTSAEDQARDRLDASQAEHDSLIEAAKAQQSRFVADGSQTREKLIMEGQKGRDDLLAQAQAQQKRLIAEAQAEHDRLLGEGNSEHKRLVDEASAERRRLLEEGRSEHQRLIAEAEEQRAGILADLNARRELLEARVADLDRSQVEYRQRLRSLVQQQLAALDDDGWQTGPVESLDKETHR